MAELTQTTSCSSEERRGSCLTALGSQSSEKLVLLFQGLESAMTVFGGSVDKLDIEWLQVRSLGGGDNALAESDGSLAGSTNSTLNHQPVLIDFTIVRESTNRGDRLLSEIHFGGAALVITLLTNTDDSLVDFGTVMVTLLTSTCNSEVDTGRMPGTNTGDLTETTMSLSWESGDTPTRDNTLGTVTTSGRADVKNFTLREDRVDRNLLFEKVFAKVNLLSDRATIKLNLQQVGNLLAKLDLADLGVSKNTDNLAVLLDAVDLRLNILGFLGELLSILGESLSLGAVPVLVESAFNFIRQVASPDSGKRTKTIGGFNISDKTDNSHWWGLKDGDSLNSVLLVKLGTRSFDFTNNVGHASFVTNEGSQVNWSLGVGILGEMTNATTVVLGSLLGEKLKGPVTGLLELAMGHL
jgi:hypothetical protein